MTTIRRLKVAGPANVKRTVALPVRKPNAAGLHGWSNLESQQQMKICGTKNGRALGPANHFGGHATSR